MFDLQPYGTIGIIFALEAERHGLAQVLVNSPVDYSSDGLSCTWLVGNVNVAAIVSGIGRERCALAAQQLISKGAQWVVAAGFAAALDSQARVGDVVVAHRVMMENTDTEPIECSASMIGAVPPSGQLGYSIWRSDLLTIDHIVLDSEEKEEIYRRTGAAALDMESYAAAEICSKQGVPFIAIRGVSDVADQSLPVEVAELAALTRWIERFAYVILRPGIWKTLWKLRKDTNAAANNLGDVLGMMLLRLI